MRALIRHGLTLAVAGLLLWLFVAVRPADLHHVHKWNRAWADVSVLLLAALFLIGPLARIWPRAALALEWRRELGIYSFVAALVHVGYYAQEAFDWNVLRFLQDSAHHDAAGAPSGPVDWRRDAWTAGNWVGIFALMYGLLPLITSNNLSQRILGSTWKRLQDHGHIFYVLSLVHLFIFWLLVYQPEARGPAPLLFWAIFAAVAIAEMFALSVMLRRRRGSRPNNP